MAVPVDQRKPSELDYLYSSMQLRDFCVRAMPKFSRKYQDILLSKLVNFAWECHSRCQHANLLPDDGHVFKSLQLSDILEAQRCCLDIDSALTLLIKKLNQNPENFQRNEKMKAPERISQLSIFMEKLAAQLVKTQDALDVRRNVLTALLAAEQNK